MDSDEDSVEALELKLNQILEEKKQLKRQNRKKELLVQIEQTKAEVASLQASLQSPSEQKTTRWTESKLREFFKAKGILIKKIPLHHLQTLAECVLEANIPDFKVTIFSTDDKRTVKFFGKSHTFPSIGDSSLTNWSDELFCLPSIDHAVAHAYILSSTDFDLDRLKNLKQEDAYAMFQDNCVRNIKMHNLHGGYAYVKAFFPSNSFDVNDMEEVWGLVQEDGRIHSSGCSCTSDNDCCKHVVALLLTLASDHKNNVPVFSKPQSFEEVRVVEPSDICDHLFKSRLDRKDRFKSPTSPVPFTIPAEFDPVLERSHSYESLKQLMKTDTDKFSKTRNQEGQAQSPVDANTKGSISEPKLETKTTVTDIQDTSTPKKLTYDSTFLRHLRMSVFAKKKPDIAHLPDIIAEHEVPVNATFLYTESFAISTDDIRWGRSRSCLERTKEMQNRRFHSNSPGPGRRLPYTEDTQRSRFHSSSPTPGRRLTFAEDTQRSRFRSISPKPERGHLTTEDTQRSRFQQISLRPACHLNSKVDTEHLSFRPNSPSYRQSTITACAEGGQFFSQHSKNNTELLSFNPIRSTNDTEHYLFRPSSPRFKENTTTTGTKQCFPQRYTEDIGHLSFRPNLPQSKQTTLSADDKQFLPNQRNSPKILQDNFSDNDEGSLRIAVPPIKDYQPPAVSPNSVGNEEQTKTADVMRKIIGAFNMLKSGCGSSVVVDMISSLQIDTDNCLHRIVNFLVDKVIDEPDMTVLCLRICELLSKIKGPSRGISAEEVSFSMAYRERYEKEIVSGSVNHTTEKYQRRMEEMTRFTTHLSRKLLLESNDIHLILMKLRTTGSQLSLDCFCTLMDECDRIEKYKLQVNLITNQKDKAFIRTLMTAICSNAVTDNGKDSKLDTSKITPRNRILKKYLAGQEEFQLEALYAVQAFVYKMDHPPWVFRTLFTIFYNNHIITEDVFERWVTSGDPDEHKGRTVAVMEVADLLKPGSESDS